MASSLANIPRVRIPSILGSALAVSLSSKHMNLRDVLARNIRKYRSDLGLSQIELGERTGCSGNYISNLELAEYAASIDMVEALANVFDIEPHELLDPNTHERSK